MDNLQFHVLKIRIFSYIFLFRITSFAGELYFCTKAGCKLYYERYKFKTMKMISR